MNKLVFEIIEPKYFFQDASFKLYFTKRQLWDEIKFSVKNSWENHST